MNEAIAGIYRAGAGAQSWNRALTAVTHELGVKGCQMAAVSANSGGILFSHVADDIPGDAELDYVRKYHAVDPRIPLVLERGIGEWLYDEDAFDDDIATTNAYYRDLLIPYGSRYTATAKLLESAGEVVMIAFLAHLDAPGFDQQQRRLLDSFGLHLREAAALYQNTRRQLATSFAGAALLDRMPRPAYLLGADRSVTYLNRAGQQQLAARSHVILRRERLAAAEAASERLLATAFDDLLDRVAAGSAHLDRTVVRLGGRNAPAPAAASLTALVPRQTMHAFGNLPQVLLQLHTRSDAAHAPDIGLWEAALDLTPAQSRVALEVYCGRTMKEAARRLKVAESTVRTHLNEVYAKTGTRRQAQLVLALAALNA